MDICKAVREVENVLLRYEEDKILERARNGIIEAVVGVRVKITLWDVTSYDTSCRVAEVTYTWRTPSVSNAGSNHFQTSPVGLMVCAAVERAILARTVAGFNEADVVNADELLGRVLTLSERIGEGELGNI